MLSTMFLLLASLLAAPSSVAAFRPMTRVSFQGSPVKAVSTRGYDDGGGGFNIRDVIDEAEEALKTAAKALDVSPATAATAAVPPPTAPSAFFFANQKPPTTAAKSVGVSPTTPVTLAAPTGEALASAFGGAALGAVAASAIAAQIPELSDSVLAYIPPLVSAAALGGAAFSGASEESKIGEMTRKVLGKTVIAFGRGIVAAIKSVAGRIAAFFLSIPGKIFSALQNRVKKTTDKIKAIPLNFRMAAQKRAEKAAADTKKAADDLAIEILATPGRVAESTKQAVNKSVDNTKQHVFATVKEVHEYPGKKYTEIENSIAALLGSGVSKQSTKVPEISLPVELPNFHVLPIVSYEF